MSSCLPIMYLGCGVGIGAAFTSYRHSKEVPEEALSDVGLAPAPSRRLLNSSGDQTCEWLNVLVSILWPRVDSFMRQLVETQIQPAIDEALPSVMKGAVKVQRCSLGKATPRFGNFHVFERSNKAIVLEIDVDVTSNLDVQIRAMRLPLGVREFIFRGAMRVELSPPSDDPPFFGGVEIFFVNPPELSIDFTGAANVADMKVVKSVVHKTVMNQLKKFLVVPARIAIDLKPDDETDEAMLKFPEPVGALRVLLKRGKDLKGLDFHFTKPRTSDPYVIIEVGQESWKSQVQHKTCNPEWAHANVNDFFVYDTEQLLKASVYDRDHLGADDLIGNAKGIAIDTLAEKSRVVDTTLHLFEGNESCGTLEISTRWFTFTSKVPVQGIPPAVARGPSQLFLAVKLKDAQELPSKSAAPFIVSISVGSNHVVKSDPSKPPPTGARQQSVTDVCLRLAQRGMEDADIADVTGLSFSDVRDIKSAHESGSSERIVTAKHGVERPCFNQILRVRLPWTDEIMRQNACLELLDRHKHRVGARVEVPLAQAIGRECNGPFKLLPGVALRASLSTRWLCLPS